MKVDVERLTSEAIAAVCRVGAHASDEVEQHLVQIDLLKARVEELMHSSDGWKRRALAAEAALERYRAPAIPPTHNDQEAP